MEEVDFLSRALAQRYLRNSAPVAFIDESYRADERADERPFYTMSAFVVEASLLSQTRERMVEIVGSDYWHTTEAFAAGERGTITDLLAFIAGSDCASVVAVQVDVDSDLEQARRECLAGLLTTVCAAGVKLAVLERRRTRSERNADEAFIRRLVAAGKVARIEAVQTSPSAEALLWAPDVVGWAMRRDLATAESGWFDMIEDRVEVVNACDGSPLNAKRPVHAAASDSGPGKPAVLADRGARRSSTSSLASRPRASQRLEGFISQVTTMIEGDVYRSTRAWIQAEFPARSPRR